MATTASTYDEAVQFCTDNASTLVAPNLHAISKAVSNVCGDTKCWIDLKCTGSHESCDTSYDEWVW